jgi:sigma-B regulation protein RsbU (phosphoserine phosphatase)
VRLDQKTITNNVINIAILVVLRLFAITYFIVSLLIFPLSVLSAGTDEIAKGNLDKIIQVRSRDEIGQLADKFNYMSKSLKKAFNEIKDKARMEAELKNAQEIQEAILPKTYPQIEKFSFSTYYQPETESGGDYYDFIDVDEKHFGVVIADVTGHGVGAGIVMSMLRSHLRTAAAGKKDTSEVLKEINPILYRDTLPNMFATIFYAVVDISTNILYYTNAGHHPAIIYNPKEPKAKLLRTGGMPIGMVDSKIFDPTIELHQVQLKKGDYCIAYTDGIIEAKSKEDNEYGEERFYAAISRHSSENLDRMRDGIIGDLKKFTEGAEQSDDITLIIIKTNS